MEQTIETIRKDMRDNVNKLTQLTTEQKQIITEMKTTAQKSDMNDLFIDLDNIEDKIEMLTKAIREQQDVVLNRK